MTNESKRPSPDELSQAMAAAAKIEQKAVDALAGLDREMTVMGWRMEFKAIMWRAVANEALRRALL